VIFTLLNSNVQVACLSLTKKLNLQTTHSTILAQGKKKKKKTFEI
jgi:hypothetical protein